MPHVHDNLDFPVCNTSSPTLWEAPLAAPKNGRVQIEINNDLNRSAGSSGYVDYWAKIPKGRYIGEELIVHFDGRIGEPIGSEPIRLILAIAGDGFTAKFQEMAGEWSTLNFPGTMFPIADNFVYYKMDDFDMGAGLYRENPVNNPQATLVLRWVPDRWVIVAKTGNFILQSTQRFTAPQPA
jgi:hypothetical protein